CRWLSATLTPTPSPRGRGEQWQITLPTEQQWQRAAQGDDGRKYPWGNDFDPQRCNTEESGIGKPTPVTQYPNGASPYGVFDMAGNVFEWCLTQWGEDSAALEGGSRRVLRGGAFDDNQNFAACAYRGNLNPRYDDYPFGVRVVCGAPI